VENDHKFKVGQVIIGNFVIIKIVGIPNKDVYDYEFIERLDPSSKSILQTGKKYVGSKEHIDERFRLKTPLEELL
jgi:hypothetical protein